METKLEKVLEVYSACDFCQRAGTKLCEENVPQEVRQVFFMTISRKHTDDITKHCRLFRLHKGNLYKKYRELKGE
ncbi:MAG: hypothetical protein ACE5K0_07365 [Candidatus Methanofastidiosia archaeon]